MARHCHTVLLVLSIVVASASAISAQTPPPAADPLAQNAALKYWSAFGLLPNFDEKQMKAIDESLKTLGPVDDKLAELLRWNEAALGELHRGAKLPRCVWALSLEDGVDMPMPHLWRARLLGKLSCLRAQLDFQQGKPAEAIDDLIDAMTLARHAANDPVLISVLTYYATEDQAIRVAAGYLNKSEPTTLHRLSERIEKLPAASTTSQAILGEKQIYLEWFIRTLSQPGGKEEVLRLHGHIEDPALNVMKGLPQDHLREGAINLRPFYDKLAAMTQLPLPEVEKAEKDLMSEKHLSGPARPLGQLLLPAASAARRAEVRHLTRVAMFKAAIAVCQDGPTALSRDAHKDPFAGGPFQYEKSNGGFRLQSKTLGGDGKPISLTIGRVPPK